MLLLLLFLCRCSTDRHPWTRLYWSTGEFRRCYSPWWVGSARLKLCRPIRNLLASTTRRLNHSYSYNRFVHNPINSPSHELQGAKTTATATTGLFNPPHPPFPSCTTRRLNHKYNYNLFVRSSHHHLPLTTSTNSLPFAHPIFLSLLLNVQNNNSTTVNIKWSIVSFNRKSSG